MCDGWPGAREGVRTWESQGVGGNSFSVRRFEETNQTEVLCMWSVTVKALPPRQKYYLIIILSYNYTFVVRLRY